MAQANRYTNWLITHNNPKMSLDEYLEAWMKHSKYVVGQIEAGDEKGTAHVQAYVILKERKRLTAMKKLDSHAHFEPVKYDNGAADYCMKEETRLEGPIEKGEKPINRNNAKDWEKIKKYAQDGEIDKIPPDIYVRCYNQIKRIEKDHQKLPKREFPKKCYWLWGEPRTGKTRMACGEDHYRKLVNKWWCAYQKEKRVVIDDVGLDKGRTLVDHFKAWADPNYNCPGETKGGQVMCVFDELYITSNYSIDEVAQTDMDRKALKARFEVIHFDKLM